MARGNKCSSSSESESNDEMPSYDEILIMLKFALVNKRSLKEKLDSSQEAYKTLLEQYENFANLNVELSTKIEQLEASATTNACTINDEQFVKEK